MATVFVRFSIDADNWNAMPRFQSVHKTLDGAVAAVPESLKKFERIPGSGRTVKEYIYQSISEIEIGE